MTASGLLLRFFTSSAIFLSRSVFSLYWTAGLLRSSVTGASSSSALRFGAAGEEVSRSFWESICACEAERISFCPPFWAGLYTLTPSSGGSTGNSSAVSMAVSSSRSMMPTIMRSTSLSSPSVLLKMASALGTPLRYRSRMQLSTTARSSSSVW